MRGNGIRSCYAQRPARRVVLVVVVLVAGAAAAFAQGKAPVPDDAALSRAQGLLREVYGKEYDEAESPAQKTALANKMLAQAVKTKGDPASHYVLLRVAKDVAVLAGDAETAREAVDRIVQAFDVDPIQTKVDCLEAVARAAKSSSQHAALAEQAFSLVDVAAAEDDFEAARKLGGIARDSARRARNYTLVKEIVARMKAIEEYEEEYAEYQKAMARLENNPTDPEANLSVGRYLCLVKGNWQKGVPMLALGSDAQLKAVAAKELEGAGLPDAQVTLGDAWWDVAQTRSGDEKIALLVRAGAWYQEARSQLPSGLAKVKVDTRLREIAELGRPVVAARPKSPPPAVAPFDSAAAKRVQQLWARHLNRPVAITNSIGMTLVLIPPGEFDMGSTLQEIQQLGEELKSRGEPQGVIDALQWEVPRHRVTITKPFYLGVCEVTQAQYESVMGANPSRFAKGGQEALGFPVEMIVWPDAAQFCNKLSLLPPEKTAGRVYRLPTEAEWEYACRAGTAAAYHFGDTLLPTQAAFARRQHGTAMVGLHEPNAWGLHNMHGNVNEWCADWWAASYYSSSPASDPTGPASGRLRVARGGNYAGIAEGCRSARRNGISERSRHSGNGFRVVLTLETSTDAL